MIEKVYLYNGKNIEELSVRECEESLKENDHVITEIEDFVEAKKQLEKRIKDIDETKNISMEWEVTIKCKFIGANLNKSAPIPKTTYTVLSKCENKMSSEAFNVGSIDEAIRLARSKL